MTEITYNEDGSIEVDNTELLNERADVENATAPLGGVNSESTLNNNKRRVKWHEPTHKPTDVLHICPVCNTRYFGRPNKAYCSTRCREVAKKRRQRQHKREIRDFKPHRGKTGEVYFMSNSEKIAFIPATNAENRTKAKKYLEEAFPDPGNDYYNQIKGVIRK